ncbi:hypothetical protein B0H14DRAFT_2830957 [Mycena olivaceomarginata]|nr:hypothetical protein B0H14DRAFT_2830957 [Mycena olivaceomarginata]
MGDTRTVRRSHSPTPTTMTTRTVKDGQEEFGEVVAEIGWGDYGGSILPPKKVKDPAREEEKAREKEREKRRREEEKERKEREKAKKREEKKASKDGKGGAFALRARGSRCSRARGYGFREKSPAPKKPKSKSKQREEERRGSDHLTSSQSNSNGNSNRDSKNSSGSRGASRPPSRGRSTMDEQYVHPYANANAYASPRAAPIPPGASASGFFPSSPPSGSAIRSQRSRPPSPPPPPDFDNAFTGAARRATWLAAPAQYSCRVVHPCTPPAAVSYFGFPFFALEEHALLGVLHEAGHPGTHPRLPLYVDEGEDCLLLCRDAGGEVGWALASFLAPLAAD